MDYTGNYRDKRDSPAYQAAIKRRISRNAKIGNIRKMPPEVRALADALDADSSERYERNVRKYSNEQRRDEGMESIEWHLENHTPFWSGSEHHQCSNAETVIDARDWDNFGDKLVASWIVFGKLSEKQMEWVLKLPKQMAERAKKFSAAQEARKGSEWQGELKERLRDLSLTVTFIKTIESGYGYEARTSLLIKFVDADGNEFGTFGSGQTLWTLEKGDEVILTGTVKEHSTYQEIKQTFLTRCKVEPAKEASNG